MFQWYRVCIVCSGTIWWWGTCEAVIRARSTQSGSCCQSENIVSGVSDQMIIISSLTTVLQWSDHLCYQWFCHWTKLKNTPWIFIEHWTWFHNLQSRNIRQVKLCRRAQFHFSSHGLMSCLHDVAMLLGKSLFLENVYNTHEHESTSTKDPSSKPRMVDSECWCWDWVPRKKFNLQANPILTSVRVWRCMMCTRSVMSLTEYFNIF